MVLFASILWIIILENTALLRIRQLWLTAWHDTVLNYLNNICILLQLFPRLNLLQWSPPPCETSFLSPALTRYLRLFIFQSSSTMFECVRARASELYACAAFASASIVRAASPLHTCCQHTSTMTVKGHLKVRTMCLPHIQESILSPSVTIKYSRHPRQNSLQMLNDGFCIRNKVVECEQRGERETSHDTVNQCARTVKKKSILSNHR